MIKEDKTSKTLDRVDKAKKRIQAQLDEDYVDLSGSFDQQIETISTGSLIINKVIGGGIPRGRITEIFGPPSTGKCLTENSYILTKEGFRKIKDLINSQIKENLPGPDSAISYQTKLYGKDGFKETSHFYNGGEKATKKITTRYGYEVEGTLVHPVLIVNKEGNFEWKKLQLTEIGDYVVIQRNQKVFSKKYIKFKKFKFEKENRFQTNLKLDNKIPTILDEKLASFLAYLIGEGTTTYQNGFLITQSEAEISDKIKNLVLELFGKELQKPQDITYGFSSKQIRTFLYEACEIDYVKSDKKKIPNIILKSPKSVQQAFLRSYYEAEGCAETGHAPTVSISSKSTEMIHQLQLMLLNFGIVSRRDIAKVDDQEYHRLFITGHNIEIFKKEIGFDSVRKNTLLAGLRKDVWLERSNVEALPHQKNKVLSFKNEVMEQENTKEYQGHNSGGKGFLNIFGNRIVKRIESIKYRDNLLSYRTWKDITKKAKNYKNLESYINIEQIAENQFFFDPIKKIEDGFGQVYDFTIPDGHNFTSNGFISHNTSLGTSICIQAQKMGGSALYLDFENAFDPAYAKILGLDLNPNKFALFQPSHLEKSTELIDKALTKHKFVKSTGEKKAIPVEEQGLWIEDKKTGKRLFGIGVPTVIVIDSISAILARKEYEGDFESVGEIGLLPRLLSRYFRKLVTMINDTNTAVVLLNQERTAIKMGPFAAAGPDYETSGGKALKYYASVRLRLTLKKKEKGKVFNPITGTTDELPIQNVVCCTSVKNKVGTPYRSGDFIIRYGEGIDNVRSVLDIATNIGVISKGGAWFEYKSLKNEANSFKAQGIEGVRDKIMNNQNIELLKELQERIEDFMSKETKIQTATDIEKEESLELVEEEYVDQDPNLAQSSSSEVVAD